jgi:hypothetical protein
VEGGGSGLTTTLLLVGLVVVAVAAVHTVRGADRHAHVRQAKVDLPAFAGVHRRRCRAA